MMFPFLLCFTAVISDSSRQWLMPSDTTREGTSTVPWPSRCSVRVGDNRAGFIDLGFHILVNCFFCFPPFFFGFVNWCVFLLSHHDVHWICSCFFPWFGMGFLMGFLLSVFWIFQWDLFDTCSTHLTVEQWTMGLDFMGFWNVIDRLLKSCSSEFHVVAFRSSMLTFNRWCSIDSGYSGQYQPVDGFQCTVGCPPYQIWDDDTNWLTFPGWVESWNQQPAVIISNCQHKSEGKPLIHIDTVWCTSEIFYSTYMYI